MLRPIGTIALFGDTLLSDTSRVAMVTNGVLVSLSFDAMPETLSQLPPL